MLKKIESIRKKPKAVRNQYAFWYAFGFTAVVTVFWLTSVPSQLGALTAIDAQNQAGNEKIQGGFSRSWDDLRASISGGIDAFNKIKEDAQTRTDGDVITTEEDIQIDFDSFFSTTTTPAEDDTPPARQVLIGTSSHALSSSTD